MHFPRAYSGGSPTGSPGEMMKVARSIVASLTLLLVASIAAFPSPASADSSAESRPTLPAECQEAIRPVYAYIQANGPSMTPEEAFDRLQGQAGEPCGFDLKNPQASTMDLAAFNDFVASLNDAAPASEDAPEAPMWTLDKVPCTLPGKGDGTIRVKVLSLPVGGSYTAAGEWEPLEEDKEIVEVSGTGALVSGVQASTAGTMFLSALPIPSIGGETGGWCNEVEEATVVKESCWWLVIWWSCTQEVKVTIRLVACGATAKQMLLDDMLFAYSHSYEDALNPCEG